MPLDENIDDTIGKIIADFSTEMAKKIISSSGGSIASRKYSVANSLGISINKYADRIYRSCSKTKTLLYSDRSVDIVDIYVNSVLSSEGKTINDNALLKSAIEKNRHLVVSGTAGSGKSMLMKHYVLQTIRTQKNKLPVFYELRNLNKKVGASLKNELFKQLKLDARQFPEKRFEDCLRKGMFVLILDGFDELDEEITERVEEELRELYRTYSENTFIISTRPDLKLNSSVLLEVFHVRKLSITQAVNLVKKVRYDEEKKAEFIKNLRASLYRKHTDFASSPLLLTMMLMTFHDFASVPEKIHIFYGQVYEVLFNKHDVAKSGYYVRSTKTALEIDDFSRLLEVFSLSSYIESAFQFTQSSALNYCGEAIKFCDLEVEKSAFLEDLLRAVCILIRDGSEISYTHRSFQEYFTALFISRLDDENFRKFIDVVKIRFYTDDVLYMLFGIDRDRFETLFVEEVVAQLINSLDYRAGKSDNNLNFLTTFFDKCVYAPDDVVFEKEKFEKFEESILGCGFGVSDSSEANELTFAPSLMLSLLTIIIKCYPLEFHWMDSKFTKSKSIDNENKVFFLASYIVESLPDCDPERYYDFENLADLMSSFSVSIAQQLNESLVNVRDGINSRKIATATNLSQLLARI